MNPAILLTSFVAVGPNCWGRGKTPDEALKNAKREAPRLDRGTKRKFRILASDQELIVEAGIDCAVLAPAGAAFVKWELELKSRGHLGW